jgi:hypothetical protein
MLTIWTVTDVARLERAIARGVLSVRFSDGRTVTYQSVDDLIKALALVRQEVSALTSPTDRVTYGTYSKD